MVGEDELEEGDELALDRVSSSSPPTSSDQASRQSDRPGLHESCSTRYKTSPNQIGDRTGSSVLGEYLSSVGVSAGSQADHGRLPTLSVQIVRRYANESAINSASHYQTSILSNGIQVRTDPSAPTTSLVCGLALSVQAGPRFEHDQTDGISYTVERSTEEVRLYALHTEEPILDSLGRQS